MRPDGLRFRGVTSGAIMSGVVVAYPFNVWLIAHVLKHGMGTTNVLGRGGGGGGGGIDPHQPQPHVTARSVAGATIASLIVLAIELWLAVQYGNL